MNWGGNMEVKVEYIIDIDDAALDICNEDIVSEIQEDIKEDWEDSLKYLKVEEID